MTKSLFAALLVCSIAGPVSSQAAKPNFTGKWSLDVAKSDFGQTPAPESVVHVIDHKEPNVKITTTTKSEMGESTSEQDLTTDGKENINKMQAMGTQQEVRVTGRWDGRNSRRRGVSRRKGPRSTLATRGHSLMVVRS